MGLGSRIRKKPSPDPGSRVKKAPNPGSGSALSPEFEMSEDTGEGGVVRDEPPDGKHWQHRKQELVNHLGYDSSLFLCLYLGAEVEWRRLLAAPETGQRGHPLAPTPRHTAHQAK